MRQLEVLNVAGMSSFGYGDNVVDARGERMRIADGFVHRLPTDPAHILGRKDFLFVSLKSQSVRTVLIRAVSLCCCHAFPPDTAKKAGDCSPASLLF